MFSVHEFYKLTLVSCKFKYEIASRLTSREMLKEEERKTKQDSTIFIREEEKRNEYEKCYQ